MSSESGVIDTGQSKIAEEALFRKIGWRVLPILWVCYLLNYLDKVNISFAQLQMKEALGLSDAVFGLAGGMLFAGLIAFEIPSNIVLPRIGFRITLLRIMVLWGLATTAICFVTGPLMLYVLRFLVGSFEAGFAPGVLYYISLYYPDNRRGQAVAIFYTAASFARIAAGPLAAVIMVHMDGLGGYQGWQWLFFWTGVPCVAMAVVAYMLLSDKPETSPWLSGDELAIQQRTMHNDGPVSHEFKWKHFVELIADLRLWAGGMIGFLILVASFGLTFWQPTLLKGMGLSITEIGWLSVLPSTCGIISAVLVARRSDVSGERCWHYVSAAIVAALGFVLVTLFSNNVYLTIASLCVTWGGVSGAYALTWVIPSKLLIGRHSATGYAILTVIQGAAGFVGPVAIATIKTYTGSFAGSLYLMAATSLASAALCIWFYYAPSARNPAPRAA